MLSKNKIKLINSLDKKKNRQEFGLFLIEGDKMVKEALMQNKVEIIEVYANDAFDSIAQSVNRVDHQLLKQASFLSNPQNAIALAKIPKVVEVKKTGRILILDDVQDPGNLGTMIRICDWFGIDTIVCSLNSVDAYNPKVVQASMGSLLRVNIFYKDLEFFIPELKLPVIASVLNGTNAYTFDWAEDCALVIGNEGNGISEKIKALCSNSVTIPNSGNAESLNASSAASILISEMSRSKMLRKL